MIRSPGPKAPASVHSRIGATLTEVLMSLLIMSIGIVSVITMFPIAVLRSIQATQLTNSRMMTQNTEQAVRASFSRSDTNPLVGAINYDILNYHRDPGVAVGAARFLGTWKPGTPYFVGQIVTPARPKGKVKPAVEPWMICAQTGISGSIEPQWETGTPDVLSDEGVDSLGNPRPQWVSWFDPTPQPTPRYPGGAPRYPAVVTLAHTAHPLTPHVASPPTYYDTRNYVVDPLGWATFNNDYNDLFDGTIAGRIPSPNDFGYVYSKTTGLAQAAGTRPTPAPPNNATAYSPFILRINGGAWTTIEAEALATHPDSWAVEVQPTVLESSTATPPLPGMRTATFPLGTDLSAITIGDCRIVLSSLSNSQTYVRDISAVAPATRTVAWIEPLPIGFVPDGAARIERRDRRFTWMATVNRDYEGHTRVTVATFFKRGLKPEEEHAYVANVGNPPAPPAINPLPHDQVVLTWNPATEPTPLIREGNYLLDAVNLRWYRIVAVSISGTTATITVDHPIPNAQITATGRVILMRGIVELFEVTL